jgi:hypothetical protein
MSEAESEIAAVDLRFSAHARDEVNLPRLHREMISEDLPQECVRQNEALAKMLKSKLRGPPQLQGRKASPPFLGQTGAVFEPKNVEMNVALLTPCRRR